MGYLNGTSCYLVGPVEHDSEFGADWRITASDFLSKLGVKVYNPLGRPYWFQQFVEYVPPVKSRKEVLDSLSDYKYIKAQKFVRDLCLRYVNSCDFVLCYLPSTKTYGTTEELAVASHAKKPIITITPDDIPSLWVLDMINLSMNYKSLSEAFNFLSSIDKAKVDLDVLGWIFIKDYPNFKVDEEYM